MLYDPFKTNAILEMSFNIEIFDSGSGQNSDLGQEQLNNMEESAKADNTKRATKWGLNRFEEWQAKRRISFDWKTVSSKELNDILRKFYAKVKTRKGRTLSPSALTGIRVAVHRLIPSPSNNRAINILKDSEFIPANNMFQAKCKLYYRSGNPKPTYKNAIEDGDIRNLVGILFSKMMAMQVLMSLRRLRFGHLKYCSNTCGLIYAIILGDDDEKDGES